MHIHTLANSGMDEAVTQYLVREIQFFIEWAFPGLNLETDIASATELTYLQRLLSLEA